MISPSGSIQKPSTGRNPKVPPTISELPSVLRITMDCGRGIRLPRITMTCLCGLEVYSSFTGAFSAIATQVSLLKCIRERKVSRMEYKKYKKNNLALCKSETLLLYAISLTQRAPIPR